MRPNVEQVTLMVPPELVTDSTAATLLIATRDVFATREVGRLDAQRGLIGRLFGRTGGGWEMRGRLLIPSERAYPVVAERLRAMGHVALFRRVADEDAILAIPGAIPVAPTRPWVAIVLFALTVLSVLFTGAAYAGEADPRNLIAGWPFALSLLGILLAHESGHFVVARRLGVPASLPYFIPFPLSLLGTLGAFIQMKAPPSDRRALLAVAAAGPLAGLVVAIPVLVTGLLLSEVQRIPAGGPFIQEGNSLLYLGLKLALFGQILPADGLDVFLHPVALAGWAGLLVTGLNLIPAGQLDGGHIAYALLGARARWLTSAVIVLLLGLGVLWSGWLIWAALIFFISRVTAAPLDDLTPLRPREVAVAVAAGLAFLLLFVPIPIVIGT